MKNITSLAFTYIIMVMFNSLIAQNQSSSNLGNEEYDIINDLFAANNSKVGIYKTTDFSKTWMYLMSPYELDNLLGPPCNDGTKIIKWANIFSDENFKEIQEKIIYSRPMILDQSKLHQNIILEDEFEPQSTSYKSVSSISWPIIVNDYAIVKRSGMYGESIIIVKKQKNKWTMICHKSVFGITQN